MFIVHEHINVAKIPVDQAAALYQKHADWFIRHFNQGHFVLGGPYVDIPDSGLFLANLPSREELDAVLSEDVYSKDDMASYEIHEFQVSMAATITPEV